VSLVPLLLRNALRNRRRSILTILSIAASFCLLGGLMAMYAMFYLHQAPPDQALRLIVRNRISFTNPIPLSYENRIASVPGVREVMVYQWFQGIYKDTDAKNNFARFAVEPDRLFIVHPDIKLPDAEKAAFIRERGACIVGRGLADRLGFKLGDHITIVGDIFPATLEFIVRGIYTSDLGNDNLYFHFDYLNEAVFKGNQDFVSMFAVLAESPEAVPAVARAIDEQFRNADTQTKTDTEQNFVLSVISFLGNVKLFLMAVCGALTLTVLLVAANTMAMSVRERVSEIGILKTLGFTKENVLFLIVGESVVLAIAGGLLGFALAYGIVAVLRTKHAAMISLHLLEISPPLAAVGMVLAVAVGLASSAGPALGAARRGILECLRLTD
jgi:putative ABC transport system permease protein